jgi:hypothetical protein
MKHRPLAAMTAAIFLILIGSPSAQAGPYADDLSKCLVASTTAADKQALVRWMFAMAALNPTVKPISNVTDNQRVGFDKQTARLFERLLTVSCRSQTKLALQYEGGGTIESSFSLLGQVAGRELFSDPQVAKGMADFGKYLDKTKFQALGLPAK